MQATVLRVHDGDTPFVDLDLGCDTWRRNIGLRLAISAKVWINAAELSELGWPEIHPVTYWLPSSPPTT